MFEKRHPDFFGALIAADGDKVHVPSVRQYTEVQHLFDEYYNYIMPKVGDKKEVGRSFKKMTLRDFDQLADKRNILKFNMDAKLSKHLNRLLV